MRHRLRRRRRRPPSRAVLDAVLEGLRRVRHRGATAADRRTGDGAGVLLPLPAALLPEPGAGLAMVFLRDQTAREAIEEACRLEGIEVAGWRPVPVSPDALGPGARASAPTIEQAVLLRPAGVDSDEAERRAHRARRRAERAGGAYIASLSFRTVTYKALCAADQLDGFYDDLRDPGLAVPFGIFHQRFSTNTEPSWERAQPFRYLCHNGEINAIQGNANWMRAREGQLGSADEELLRPVLDTSSSDSAMLDNAVELLVHGGRDVRHAVTMLVRPAWESDSELDPEVRSFYRFHSGLVEPWDGPAGIVFTDGRVVGAALDRNGLRPLRYAVASDGFVACVSEVGAVPLDGHGQVRRGKLGPGEILAVDPERGFEGDYAIKGRLAARRPYGRWLEESLVAGSSGTPVEPQEGDLASRQVAFGYTREELMQILRPIAAHSHEPTSSMGDDTALPPLAGRARPLHAYFKQRFAQVTNPPIDHLRERHVMSLRTLLGARAPLLSEEAPRRSWSSWRASFSTRAGSTASRRPRSTPPSAPRETLEAACGRLAAEAETAVRAGADVLLVSDAGASSERAPVPALLATGAVHHGLVEVGLRSLATIVVASDEPREVHHFACLLGYGAEAVCPRLALETVAAMAAADKVGGDHPSADEAQRRFRSDDRGRRHEGDGEDGDLGRGELLRRPALRHDRARAGGCRPLLPGNPVPTRRHRFRRAGAGRSRAAGCGLGGPGGAPAPRLLQASKGRRAARDEPGGRGRAPRDRGC